MIGPRRTRRSRLTHLLTGVLAGALVAAFVAGCGSSDGGDGGGQGAPVSTPSPTYSTPPPATTVPAPSPSTETPSTPSTAVSPSTVSPPTVSTPTASPPATCEPIGGREEQRSGFPGSLSSLVGVAIRTGAHPCFERIVIEFAPGDAPTPAIAPGFWVRYTDEPITLGQTDDQFVELRGEADLLITVESWMYEVDESGRPIGYAGPIDLFPTNVDTIEEIRLIDNWEGVQVWAVGLDRERDLRVTVLDDPVRLVVDLGA